MKQPAGLWAIATAIAQMLPAACASPEPRPELARGGLAFDTAEPPPPAPAESSAPVDVEAFAERLPPDKVPLPTPELPSRGALDAPVTIQVWSDFECPFCARAAPLLRELEALYGPKLRIVWRNLPLPGHPHAELAAVAGSVVHQSRGGAAFWRYHDALFDAAPAGLDEASVLAFARREGVSDAAIQSALATGAGGRIAADMSAADQAGVRGTPALLVNDWLLVGVVPLRELSALVERALADRAHGARR